MAIHIIQHTVLDGFMIAFHFSIQVRGVLRDF